MKNHQKPLVELNQEIPALEQTKEGLLKGGFCALTPQKEALDTRAQQNDNSDGCTCINQVCNDGCTNNGCNNDGCTNKVCTTESTVPGNTLTVGSISTSLMF